MRESCENALLLQTIPSSDLGELGAVVVARVHHTVADGMSLIGVAREVLASANGGPIDLEGSSLAAALAKGRRESTRSLTSFGLRKVLLQ